MRFHPDTPILPTLEPYFACSDPMICSCTKFVRNGFSWYLHKSHPQSIDCPHHIDELMGLLMQSFNPTPLTATAISLEPMEVLHMLRQLVKRTGQSYFVTLNWERQCHTCYKGRSWRKRA